MIESPVEPFSFDFLKIIYAMFANSAINTAQKTGFVEC